MHGFQRGNEIIHITYLPNLKKPILAIGNQYVMQKIASFDSEEYAEGFTKMLEKWFGTEEQVEASDARGDDTN